MNKLVKILTRGLLITSATTPLFANTTVSSGDLAQIINNSSDTEFTLEGDVDFGSIINMNSAKGNITINGQGHTITQTNNNYYFDLSQANAVLTITNANIGTSSTSGTSQAMIYAHGTSTSATGPLTAFTANLDGTVFDGLRGGGTGYNGAAIQAYSGADLTVNGNVTFRNNVSQRDNSPGAVSAWHHSSITFTGITSFENNYIVGNGYYGGAMTIYENSTITFSNDSTFTGNHSTAFGGAIDLWYGTSKLASDSGTVLTFMGNYTAGTIGTAAGSRGNRGGAINISDAGGTPPDGGPQISLLGETVFDGNYAWNLNTNGETTAVGGAVSMASGTVTTRGVYAYDAEFGKATFRNNYVGTTSASGIGLGGAVFHNGSGSLTFGDGSLFENNYAQTSGGAIYINAGTLNLNGGMTFRGNLHGVSFDTSGPPIPTSGTANAIYFGNVGDTAKLNLAPGDGQTIHFYDPIATKAGAYVTINKTSTGEVIFYGKNGDANYNSTLFNKTTVSAGSFKLTDGVTFGINATNANNTFTVDSAGTLRGGMGSTLATGTLTVKGRVMVEVGGLNIQAANNVTFASDAVLAIVIADKNNFGTLDLGGKSIIADLGSIDLQILDTGYIPSSDISNLDRFEIISSISTADLDIFKEKSYTIQGAEFELLTEADTIYLQQKTTPIPEPSTYALIAGGIGIFGLIMARRRKSAK